MSKSGIESAIDFAMVGKYPDLRELQTVSRLDKRHCSSSKCKNLNLFSLLVHSSWILAFKNQKVVNVVYLLNGLHG